MPPIERAPKKEIFGWAMFDFANSVYTLLIVTVVFGDLFTRVIVGDRGDDYRYGNLLWSLSLATGYLLVVVTAPVCGAVMDLTAARKGFLFVSYIVTVAATAMLWFVTPGFAMLGVMLIVVSNYAYSIGESFIASFLPDLGPPEDLGWISGFGWALGYVGGLVATGFALFFLGEVSVENFDNVRWVGPFAGFFFLVAAIPTFLWVRERGIPHPDAVRGFWRLGLARVRETVTHLRSFHDLAVFLVSIFFAMAGIYIIITFTFIYGAQVIRWDEDVRIYTFVVVQVTATAGALLFGWIQGHVGGRATYAFTLLVWIAAILLIWRTPAITQALNEAGRDWQMQHVFLVVAIAAGLCLGATQSASRAIVGQLAPRTRAAEFFGFWGLSNKLAAILGMVGIGLMQAWVGLQNAILLCAVFFALAFVVCLFVNMRRGRQAVEAYEAVSR